jgi:hypothetical protein
LVNFAKFVNPDLYMQETAKPSSRLNGKSHLSGGKRTLSAGEQGPDQRAGVDPQ